MALWLFSHIISEEILSPYLLAAFSFPKILAGLISYPKRHFYPSENKRHQIFRRYESLRRDFTTENSSLYSNSLRSFKATKTFRTAFRPPKQFGRCFWIQGSLHRKQLYVFLLTRKRARPKAVCVYPVAKSAQTVLAFKLSSRLSLSVEMTAKEATWTTQDTRKEVCGLFTPHCKTSAEAHTETTPAYSQIRRRRCYDTQHKMNQLTNLSPLARVSLFL